MRESGGWESERASGGGQHHTHVVERPPIGILGPVEIKELDERTASIRLVQVIRDLQLTRIVLSDGASASYRE